MSLRRILGAIGGAAASSIVVLLGLAAWILSPFRVGRLLRVVSIPRMREHRLRTTLTALGIAVGVASLVAVTIVNRSILRGVESTVDDLAGKTDLQVGAGSIGFDEGLLDQIKAVKDVHASTPVLQQTAMIHDPRGIRERILLLGADFLGDSDSYFRTYESTELTEIKRDPLPFLNSPTNIIISRALADRMGYKLHDKIPIVTTDGVQQFDIWGFVENQGVGRAFGGSVGFMYYAGMQVAFGRGHNIDRVDVAVTPGVDAELVKQTLAQRLGPGIVVERPVRKGERISNMLTSFRMALLMASAIALVVGTFLIYNTMAISVVQRKRELGILRAIGTTRRQLLLLLTLEGALLGVVSSSIGLLGGIALARGLLRITSEALSEAYLQVAVADLQIDPGFVAVSFLLGTLAATLAAALPAYRAAAKSPVQMLRTGGLTASHYAARPTRTDVAGLVLLPVSWLLLHASPKGGLPFGAIAALMTLLLAGSLLLPRFVQLLHYGLLQPLCKSLGIEARLASSNLPRDLGRTSTTAGALMVGVAMATSFAIFIHSFMASLDHWLTQSVPGDLFVSSGAGMSGSSTKNIPMADAIGDQLATIPQIENIRRLRVADIVYRDTTVKLMSTEIELYAQRSEITMLEGQRDRMIGELAVGQVAISENLSRRFGIHLGDSIELGTKDGTHAFKVAGVIIDYTSDMGSVLVDRAAYVKHWGDTRVDTFVIYLRSGADTEAVRHEITQRYGEVHNLFVLTHAEWRGQIEQTLDQVFALMRTLEILAIVIAALGVVNALLANVLDRVREIGVLRAVGTLRRQLRRVVVIEAVLVGVLGAVSGAALGLELADVMLTHINVTQTGWYFAYHAPWLSILGLMLITLPISAFAGWYPAREAAQLNVCEALSYE